MRDVVHAFCLWHGLSNICNKPKINCSFWSQIMPQPGDFLFLKAAVMLCRLEIQCDCIIFSLHGVNETVGLPLTLQGCNVLTQ